MTNLQTLSCKYFVAVDGVREKLNIKLYQFNEEVKQDVKLLKDVVDLRENLQETSGKTPKEDIEKGSHSDKLCYIYTSGTTGLPKAAVITNNRYSFILIINKYRN